MPAQNIVSFPSVSCLKCSGTGQREKLVRREKGSDIRYWTMVQCKCQRRKIAAVAQVKAA